MYTRRHIYNTLVKVSQDASLDPESNYQLQEMESVLENTVYTNKDHLN